MFIVHRGVRQEMNFICLSHDGVTLDVDHDVSTPVLLIFIRPEIRYLFLLGVKG